MRINITEAYYIANMHTSKVWTNGTYTVRASFLNNPCDIGAIEINVQNLKDYVKTAPKGK